MHDPSQSLPAVVNGESDFADRFWYWRGASGRSYIHSIYPADACPPLPGAVFVAAKRLPGGHRIALKAGRISPLWDVAGQATAEKTRQELGADEIHVHLLTESDRDAAFALADLLQGISAEVCAPESVLETA